jgi:miniconductance mechanosensitive channel
MNSYIEQITQFLDVEQSFGPWLHIVINLILLIAFAISAFYFSRFSLKLILKLFSKTLHPNLDLSIKRHNLINRSARLGSLLSLIATLKILASTNKVSDDFLLLGVELFAVFVFIQITFSILNVISDVYKTLPFAKDVPIKGFIQISKLFISLVVIILITSIFTDKSPVYLLSSLGALTAIIILVFRDTILGFVGGIQIIANRLISVGDWVEIPTYNTDGEVLEIGLNIIKVQNWDKTISSIPTHSVMTSSFKNWKGMSALGSRRIKRAINIDQTSIQALNPNQTAHYLEQHPLLQQADLTLATSNLALYRRYLELWLQQHPKINQSLTLLVRELSPTISGLPVEIYCFSNDNAWRNYEEIQADIINFAILLLKAFELKPFQQATGHDITQAIQQLKS